ncbi:MAG: hypothetical protein ACFFAO_12045 [Candidatus Hermodarchaeota archaeon]
MSNKDDEKPPEEHYPTIDGEEDKEILNKKPPNEKIISFNIVGENI